MLDLSPNVVFLVYNCHYMTNICANANRFINVIKNKHVHTDYEGLDMDDNGPTFGFDFNKGSNSRPLSRGRHVCPSNWKANHRCPEPDQNPVWRDDGERPYTSTESGSMVLEHLRTGGQIAELSKL